MLIVVFELGMTGSKCVGQIVFFFWLERCSLVLVVAFDSYFALWSWLLVRVSLTHDTVTPAFPQIHLFILSLISPFFPIRVRTIERSVRMAHINCPGYNSACNFLSGKPGEPPKMKDEKEIKPVSMRVRDAAESLLMLILDQVSLLCILTLALIKFGNYVLNVLYINFKRTIMSSFAH